MEQYFPLLLNTPLFTGIDEAELSSMLGCFETKVLTLSKGEPVFLEGDPAGFVGMVLEGGVQLTKDDYYGNRSIISYAGPGELFAEVYASAGEVPLPISGYALKDSKVLLMSCKKVLTLCGNTCPFHNRLIQNLLQAVARANLNLSRKIELMSKKTTREKLMAYLSEEAKQQGRSEFTIPLDRQALADYLGVERSAMSAELSKLRKAGLIDFKGSRFQLLTQ